MRKIKIISVFLIAMCIFTLVSCKSSKVNEDQNVKKGTNNEDINSTKNTSEEKPKYAEDEVVNNFIENYNSISNSPIINIEKGNIRTKYFGETYGYRIEMLNANDTNKIVLTINKTEENENIGMEGMKEVFHDAIKVIILDVSEEDINNYFDNLVSNEYMVTEEAFNQTEILFVPDKELSYGHSSGHIEISSK